MKEHILLVDDEPDMLEGISRLLAREFPELVVHRARSGREALTVLAGHPVAMALLDVKMPGMDGLELLAKLKRADPELTAVMVTGYGCVEMAVQAMKQGAWDFIMKPLDPEFLCKLVAKGLERNRLLRENISLRQRVGREGFHGFVGESPAMQRFYDQLRTVAASGYNLLIRGESGTGKELAARAVHALSGRRSRSLVMVNCPAIPEHLLESELFGHVRGAFTGADHDRSGLFLQADSGTICLDEIGDIPLAVQAKLLRVLEEGEVRPLGASRPRPLDVRVVAMTNQDLEEKIRQREFREDLFYRLNVVTLWTPPLRVLGEDIPLLADHFLRQAAAELDRLPPRLEPELLARLAGMAWPGNVRQLKNTMRKLVLFAGQEEVVGRAQLDIVLDPVPAGLGQPGRGAGGEWAQQPYHLAKEQALGEFTRGYLDGMLRATNGNVSQAAARAGLTRSALQKILRRFGIEANSYRPGSG